MKKKWMILLIAAVLLVSAGNAAAAMYVRNRNTDAAQAAHATVYDQYLHFRQQAEAAELTVTENGETVGAYSLAQLGLLDGTLAEIDRLYSETDRLPPEEFAALSYKEKMAWTNEPASAAHWAAVPTAGMDTKAVLADLTALDRTAAEDACLYLENGAYRIRPEVPGTELEIDAVTQALVDCVGAMTVSLSEPAAATLEIAEAGCYAAPAVTVLTNDFDYSERLAQDLQKVEITLDFHGSSETVPAKALVSVDDSGALQVDTEALTQLAAKWAQTYEANHTAYLFDSYVDGPVAIPFLTVDYDVDTEALVSLLTGQLLTLESAALEAPWLCERNGEPFAIADTYIAVDIRNQNMVYYKDGEMIVCTDVVTGYPNGHNTPRGFWAVQNRLTDQLLVGPDYEQFVRWWVGVHGAYGIHDASWRSEFGGQLYLTDGSHGCINTPDDAMELLYQTVEVGTPVLFFGS